MDLFSLPQEMLASVLKYVPFNSMLNLRKMSSTVDATATGYKLQKLNLNQFKISKEDDKLIVRFTPIATTEGAPVNNFQKSYDKDKPLSNILQFYFSKMRRLNRLELCGKEEDALIITEEAAATIIKQRSLKITELHIDACKLQFDMKLLQNILTSQPIRDLYLQLPGRVFVYKNEDSELTISSLRQLCSQKLPRSLLVYNFDANVKEFGEFLEEHINDSFNREGAYWYFVVKPGNMDVDQIKDYLKNLKCLSKKKTDFRNNPNSLSFSAFGENNLWLIVNIKRI